jgi:hypothetical protein
MSEPRVSFQHRSWYSNDVYRFYEDRIERDWTDSFRSGTEVYPTSGIAARLGEQSTFAYGIELPLRRMAIFLLGGLVFHLGYDHPVLNWVAYLLYSFAGLAAIVAITKLRKDRWLYVKHLDGRTLFSVREQGLRNISREEFVREIQKYASKS